MLGTMARAESRPERRLAVLNAAIDAGIDTVDTAPLYEFGDSERWVGQTLRNRPDRPIVCTKVGLRWDTSHGEILFKRTDEAGSDQAVRKDSREASVREQIESSRTRLGVDTIDLVQVHFRDVHTPLRDTMKALADAVRAGEVRAVGICNFTLEEAQAAQRALGQVPLASVQLSYSLLDRHVEDTILPWARREHIAMLAYAPLAEGLLAGRRLDGGVTARWPLDAVYRAVDQHLRPVAYRHDASPAEVALAWLLAQPGVTAVIAGASTPAQITANARAAELALTPAECEAIDRAFRRLGGKVDGVRRWARATKRKVKSALNAWRGPMVF